MIKVSFCAQRERGSDVQGRTPFNSAFCWTSFKEWVPLKRGWGERYPPVMYQHRVGCDARGCASASRSSVDVCPSGDVCVPLAGTRPAEGRTKPALQSWHTRQSRPDTEPLWPFYLKRFFDKTFVNVLGRKTPQVWCIFLELVHMKP